MASRARGLDAELETEARRKVWVQEKRQTGDLTGRSLGPVGRGGPRALGFSLGNEELECSLGCLE
jgi:hypothetical protein